MEIAAESGHGTTLSGNLMVANRPLATQAVLAIPISRLLLRGMRSLAGRMNSGEVVQVSGRPYAKMRLSEISKRFASALKTREGKTPSLPSGRAMLRSRQVG
jgi:hypothetical protein